MPGCVPCPAAFTVNNLLSGELTLLPLRLLHCTPNVLETLPGRGEYAGMRRKQAIEGGGLAGETRNNGKNESQLAILQRFGDGLDVRP